MHACRGELWPKTMKYSLRSNCLVALYESRDSDLPYPTSYSAAITVLDLAAGGRMLCHLGDFMCALQPQVPFRLTCPLWYSTCAFRMQGGEHNCGICIAGRRLRQRGGGRVCPLR